MEVNKKIVFIYKNEKPLFSHIPTEALITINTFTAAKIKHKHCTFSLAVSLTPPLSPHLSLCLSLSLSVNWRLTHWLCLLLVHANEFVDMPQSAFKSQSINCLFPFALSFSPSFVCPRFMSLSGSISLHPTVLPHPISLYLDFPPLFTPPLLNRPIFITLYINYCGIIYWIYYPTSRAKTDVLIV